MVDRDGVLAEAARGLDEDEEVPEAERGEDDVALRVRAPVDEHLAGRGPPVLLDRLAQLLGERGEPAAVVGGGDADRVGRELFLGEPVPVVAARVDERADQLVAVAGLDAGHRLRAEVVALGEEAAQQGDSARGGVETDRVADAGVLGGVRGQDEREALVGRGDVAQAGVAHGDPGDARGALGVGDVGGEAVGIDLLEGEGDGDEAAVELGYGDLAGGVERRDALVVLRPVGARAGEAQGLEDRYVEPGERARVPRLLVAARARLGGACAARGEDGGDEDVGGAERVEQPLLGGAQRGHVERERLRPRLLDGLAQGVHEAGVAAHVVGAVVEHRDDRTRGGARGAVQGAPGGRWGGRVEAVPGEEHGVGEEAGEVFEVRGAAVGEVRVGLGREADRDGGRGHELGVRCLLTAQHHDGPAVGEEHVEPLLPDADAAEEPYDDEVDAFEEGGEFVEREPRGVREAVRDRARGGAGAEQVRVGRRQEQEHAASGPSSGCPRPGRCSDGGSS
ncbi:hypothetical protein GA0115246_100832 [Streptomyces sp. SolWspMP-sol7th]|nr:hypothetical protein GA0115246_100832 [Streptomyces sp. SolWspMP-sol7th]